MRIERSTGNREFKFALMDFERIAPELFRSVRDASGFPVIHSRDVHGFRYVLDCLDNRLCVLDSGNSPAKPFSLDFEMSPRRLFGADILRRAMGRGSKSVIDATTGFGQDTFHLARLGFKVVAVERCLPIALLLQDALSRIQNDALRASIHLLIADSRMTLRTTRADVVYMDPMFDPHDTSRSLPRKHMVLARAMAGDDRDAGELLDIARHRFRRVVVKRPDKSPPLSEGVHHHHRGKTVRYDVYVNTSISVRVDEKA
jgi:hypothetical protein